MLPEPVLPQLNGELFPPHLILSLHVQECKSQKPDEVGVGARNTRGSC